MLYHMLIILNHYHSGRFILLETRTLQSVKLPDTTAVLYLLVSSFPRCHYDALCELLLMVRWSVVNLKGRVSWSRLDKLRPSVHICN
jgi:hypothetical protein